MKILPNHLLQFEVGETIECNGKTFVLVNDNECRICGGCPFRRTELCRLIACMPGGRDDGEWVHFVEVNDEKEN